MQGKSKLGKLVKRHFPSIPLRGEPETDPGKPLTQGEWQVPRDGVVAIPPAAPGAGLLDLAAVMPLCRVKCEFWELGPARNWVGWNWCADCFPVRAKRPAQLPPAPRDLPPAPKRLKSAKKKRKK